MTTFEIIILTALYIFAFIYMFNCMGAEDIDHPWLNSLIVLFAGTFGVICFPGVFARDIWNKLNKEE